MSVFMKTSKALTTFNFAIQSAFRFYEYKDLAQADRSQCRTGHGCLSVVKILRVVR